MSRGLLAALTAACVAFAPCALTMNSAQAAKNLNSGRSNIDRMGGGAKGNPARSKTVKSSKSNSSERMGGGGGVRSGGGVSPTDVINLNGSQSNSY